ncbi:NAD(+)/NADH kinase, partial [Bacillus sp. S34]|nr:NAD(+)/NADH kinase [Bacillus sp. S34]
RRPAGLLRIAMPTTIAATPAGSTAYNYAAGGPVLSPALSGSVVTPVAPMAGIDRAVVLAARERFRFD